MPKGVAPAGSGVGEVVSSLRVPPLTVKALIELAAVPTTQSVWPSGLSLASSAPSPAVLNGVLPISASDPSLLIV